MSIKNPGFTMYKQPISPSYLAWMRKEYKFPDYHDPAYYQMLSRYKNVRTIKNEDNRIVHETMNNYKIPEYSEEKRYTVSNKFQNRLDIISLMFYKTPEFWWIIAIANDIIDPLTEIKEGTVLRIPDIMSLYQTGSIFE